MNLETYQQETKRTLPDLGSEKLNLAHMVLGIFSEEAELTKAIVNDDTVNIGEEVADKFWYISNYCNLRGYSIRELYEWRNEWIDEIAEETDCEIYGTSCLQDLIKKNLAYNKPIDLNKEILYLKMVLSGLSDLITEADLDLETILENNINKLKVRFPEKFTEELALNRNLEEERKELEK